MIHLLLAIFDFNISLLLLIFTKLERFLFKIDFSVTGFDSILQCALFLLRAPCRQIYSMFEI